LKISLLLFNSYEKGGERILQIRITREVYFAKKL